MIKYFVIRKFRGTYSSVGMLKGCMAKKKDWEALLWLVQKVFFVFNDNFMSVEIVYYISRNNFSNLLRTSQGECHYSGS